MAKDEKPGEILNLHWHILQGITDLKEEVAHVKQRQTALDQSLVNARKEILVLHGVVVQVHQRLDRIDERIARIERRLDPIKPADD